MPDLGPVNIIFVFWKVAYASRISIVSVHI